MRSSAKEPEDLVRLISNISRAVHKSGLRSGGLQTGKNCVFTTIGIGSHHITIHFELRPYKKCGNGLRIYITTENRKALEVKIPETSIAYHQNIKNVTLNWLEEKIVQALKQIRSIKKTTE